MNMIKSQEEKLPRLKLVQCSLRNMFYNRLQRLSYAFHDRSQTGQLMSRATADIEGVRAFVGFALLRGIYFVVLMIVITVLLLSLNRHWL
jgi:ATP-binding cassette subfamily B protein